MLNQTKTQKALGKYRVIRTLGTGLFKVKLVYDPASGKQYAAKICKCSLKKSILEKEANLMRELSNTDVPNVIKYVEYVDNAKCSFKNNNQTNYGNIQNVPEYNFQSALILELAHNGTLFDVIYQNGKLEEKLARTYFKKLLETVSTLHQKGYVHRDLKPENLLIDNKFQFKLADFGFARNFTSYNKDKMTTKLGTKAYIAPEMHTYKPYSGVKIDSFACGVLLFLFVFGRPPFFTATANDQLYRHFVQEKPEKFWEVYEDNLNDGKEFNRELKKLITDLLKYNPNERVKVEDIGAYEWIKGDVYADEDLVDVMAPLKTTSEQGNKNFKK